MTKRTTTARQLRTIASFFAGGLAVLLWCFPYFGYSLSEMASAADEASPSVFADPEQPVDYSRFRHGNEYHTRLPCLVCHRRDDNSARLSLPGKINHLPCAGCHGLQFSDPASPICTICHTNPQSGALKQFPGLRSFNARFNHSRHSRVNCVTCHAPEGRGVARNIPSGRAAHVTCFQCHTASSSNAMASCSTCHQPGRLVRVSESALAFRRGFSHARHSRNMNCRSCHTVRAGSARGRQVSSPTAAMHFAPAKTQSCASCHNGERAFGTDTFANCKRCHVANTFRF